MGIAIEVFLPNDSMAPFILRSVRAKEFVIGIEGRVQSPVALPLGIERLARCDSLVDVSGEDEAMWQAIAPSHNFLDDAMKPAELRERGHVNASPNRRILAFKNDEQLNEIGKISHLHYSTRPQRSLRSPSTVRPACRNALASVFGLRVSLVLGIVTSSPVLPRKRT